MMGRGEDDLRMGHLRPGIEVSETEPESVFTLGYEVNGQRGLYPARHPHRHGLPGVQRARLRRVLRHDPAGRRLLDAAVRPGDRAGPRRGRGSPVRRTAVLVAVIVTALLLQTAVFPELTLAGCEAGAALPGHGRLRGAPGTGGRRGRRLRERSRAGLHAQHAEGDHGAHAHDPGLHRRTGSAIHHLALAPAARGPRGSRHGRWRRLPSGGGLPPRRGGGSVQLRGEGHPRSRPSTERCSRRSSSRSSAGRRPRPTPAGWCASRWSGRGRDSRSSPSSSRSCSCRSRRVCGSSRSLPGRNTTATRATTRSGRWRPTRSVATSSTARGGASSTTGSASRSASTATSSGTRAEATLAHLSEILGIPAQELGEELDTKLYYSYQPVPVAEFVPEEVYFKIREEPEKFKGVEVVEQSVRSYPQGMLGGAPRRMGRPDQAERDRRAPVRRLRSLGPGRQGRHRSHLRTMASRGAGGGAVPRQLGRRGPPRVRSEACPSPVTICGSRSTSTSNGSPRKSSRQGSSAPEPSSTRAPEPNLAANAGAVVVLDPNTGGIVAMASWPTFPPSWFVRDSPTGNASCCSRASTLLCSTARRRSRTGRGRRSSRSSRSPRSRRGRRPSAATTTVPPSTSTPATSRARCSTTGTATAAARCRSPRGSRSRATRSTTSGGATSTSWTPRRTSRSSSVASSNGASDGSSGVDLPAEAAGTVPDRKYVNEHPSRYPDGWIPGIDILLAIGAGEMKATPLQVAQAYAAIASGKLCQPHLVSTIEDAAGNVAKKIGGKCRRIPYTETELDYIREALRSVTTGGTASSVFAPCSLDVAGKTGTAERPPFQDTSWFAGHRSRGSTPVRGRGHRGAGRVRCGDRGTDRSQHHEQDLPNPLRGAGAGAG